MTHKYTAWYNLNPNQNILNKDVISFSQTTNLVIYIVNILTLADVAQPLNASS